jgi:hypothetical protein
MHHHVADHARTATSTDAARVVARAAIPLCDSAKVKRCLALAVLFVLGCSNDPGALYARGDAAKDSGADRDPSAAKPEPVPPLPALPDADHIPDCTRCAADMCKEARANCLEDDYCTDEPRCKGKCDNLACLQGCSAEFGWSAWYGDYVNCVFGQCLSECNTGNNWQCEGNYDWPAAGQSSFDVRFRFTAPPTFFLGTQAPNNLVATTRRASRRRRHLPRRSAATCSRCDPDSSPRFRLGAGDCIKPGAAGAKRDGSDLRAASYRSVLRHNGAQSRGERHMAIVMQMHWPEVTKDQYEQVRKLVAWETQVPKGAKYHVAWFGKDGFHVIDVWASAQDFNTFLESRLMPGIQKIGIKGQPKVEISDAHATFAPNP